MSFVSICRMNSMRLLIILTVVLYETQRAESTFTLLKTLVSKHLHHTTEEPISVECEPEIKPEIEVAPEIITSDGYENDAMVNRNEDIIILDGETYDIVGEVVDDQHYVAINDGEEFEAIEDKFVEYPVEEIKNEKKSEIDDVKHGIHFLKDKIIEKIKSVKSKFTSKKESVKPVTEISVPDDLIEHTQSYVITSTGTPITTTTELPVYVNPGSTVESIAAGKLLNTNIYGPNVKINGDIGLQEEYVNIQRHMPQPQRKMYFLPSPPYPLLYNYHPYGPMMTAKSPTIGNTPYYFGANFQNQRTKFEPTRTVVNRPFAYPKKEQPAVGGPWYVYDDSKLTFPSLSPTVSSSPQTATAKVVVQSSTAYPSAVPVVVRSSTVYPSAAPVVVSYSTPTMQPVAVYPTVDGLSITPQQEGVSDLAPIDENWSSLYENAQAYDNAEGSGYPQRGDIRFAGDYVADIKAYEQPEVETEYSIKQRRHVKEFDHGTKPCPHNTAFKSPAPPTKTVLQSAPVFETPIDAKETPIASEKPIASETPLLSIPSTVDFPKEERSADAKSP